MPEGLNRQGDFRNGTPITLPHDFGTDITSLTPEGNPIPTSGTEQNIVTWLPNPAHFGNPVPPTDASFNSNPVTWSVNPSQFGNIIGGILFGYLLLVDGTPIWLVGDTEILLVE